MSQNLRHDHFQLMVMCNLTEILRLEKRMGLGQKLQPFGSNQRKAIRLAKAFKNLCLVSHLVNPLFCDCCETFLESPIIEA